MDTKLCCWSNVRCTDWWLGIDAVEMKRRENKSTNTETLALANAGSGSELQRSAGTSQVPQAPESWSRGVVESWVLLLALTDFGTTSGRQLRMSRKELAKNVGESKRGTLCTIRPRTHVTKHSQATYASRPCHMSPCCTLYTVALAVVVLVRGFPEACFDVLVRESRLVVGWLGSCQLCGYC
jgi:hypothetical protein